MKLNVIAEFLESPVEGDGEVEITGVASIESALNGDIAFVERADKLSETHASCILVPPDFAEPFSGSIIRVRFPKLAFAKVAALLSPPEVPPIFQHSFSAVSPDADVSAAYIDSFVTIGRGTIVGKHSKILSGTRVGEGVTIGRNCVIHPNCVIYDNVTIGDDCVIHAGAVIGADGFGYVRDGASGYIKFPQIGTVSIGNDVEIGAGTCIDRGALGATKIGNGTKIDNLVQIAHNVEIGERVVIASQTGISGSTVIEDDCVIGGQVGFGDHATVKKGAVIGSQAGVLPGKIVREGVWWGTPVQPLDEYKRQNAHVKGLGRLKDEVRELKKKFETRGP